jgi:cytosine deaminase
MTDYDMKGFFLSKVAERGGFACHHAHFDKAYLISPDNLQKSQQSLQEKWYLYRELKQNYTFEDLMERMSRAIDNMIAQGVSKCRTFVDADSLVGLLPIQCALQLKEEYLETDGFDLQIAVQPLEGVLDPQTQKAFVQACELADVIGGLPDRDGSPLDHMDFIFSLAKELGKPVDVHVGQNNVPHEQESEMVADKVVQHGLEGQVRLVHAISLACQPEKDRRRVISKLRDTGTGVVVCPSAAISMRQRTDLVAPIHNSIAPVMELLEGGVEVMLGVDNIHDLFMPLVDGDLWFESRLMMEAIRCYDLDLIASIASNPKGFTSF